MSVSEFKGQCTCGTIAAHQRIIDLILDTQIDPLLAKGLCGLNGACHPVRDVQLERTTNVRGFESIASYATLVPLESTFCCYFQTRRLTQAHNHKNHQIYRWVAAASSPSSSSSSPLSFLRGLTSHVSGPAPASTTKARTRRIPHVLACLARE